MKNEDASSNNNGVILMVAVTVMLASMVLVMCLGFLTIPAFKIAMIPEIFVITAVLHDDSVTHAMQYDSRLIIRHTGTETYRNRDLKAVVYRDDVQLGCQILTLNGGDFPSTAHFGVENLRGPGCIGDTWLPGEMTEINLSDYTFRPGNTARIDIIEKSTNTIISRHRYRVT